MAEATATSPDTTTETSANDEASNGGWSVQRVVTLSVLAFIAIYILIFVIGLVAAIIWNEQAAAFFRYFRDLMTIALAVSSVVIIIGIGILIIQIARFVNLLRSEVKPITDDTKQAIRNVRTTTEFVKKHAVEPVMQIHAFVSGLIAFLWEIVQLSRMLQERDIGAEDDKDEGSADDAEA